MCQSNLRRLPFSLAGLVLLAITLAPRSRSLIAADPLWVSGTASSPTYRILPRPLPEHQGKHLPYSTTRQPMEKANYESRATESYAYGWFGPRPSPQWSRHFGYHQSYTQWSLK